MANMNTVAADKYWQSHFTGLLKPVSNCELICTVQAKRGDEEEEVETDTTLTVTETPYTTITTTEDTDWLTHPPDGYGEGQVSAFLSLCHVHYFYKNVLGDYGLGHVQFLTDS